MKNVKRAIAGAFSCAVLLAGCGSDATVAPTPVPQPSPGPAPAATPSRLELSASPSRLLLSGSTITVTGRFTDSAGAPLAGRTIQLSTAAGSLSSTLPVTDSSGAVTVTLTGNGPTTVLASSSGINASLDVPAIEPFTVTVDSKYSVITPPDTVEIYVTVTPAAGVANAPAPTSVTLSCGNGQTINLGDQRTTNCTFREKDTYVVTATATAANGWSTSGTVRVSAIPKEISVTLTYREVAHGAGEIEVEFIVVGAPERSVCMWDFGEGTKRTGACNQNIVYALADTDDGEVTVSVIVDPRTGADKVTIEKTITLNF